MAYCSVIFGHGRIFTVVGMFEGVVSQIAIIVCFLSLILDMAGNVGTQSLAVTIRVLMDENLKAKRKIQLVLKEMRVGFSNGLVLGVLSFLFIGFYVYLLKGKDIGVCFCYIGMRRSGTYGSYGNLQSGRHSSSYVSQDQNRSGSGFRSVDYNSK